MKNGCLAAFGDRVVGTAQLLTVDQAADRLGTSPRFIRRLITERRIAFTRIGRHIRLDVLHDEWEGRKPSLSLVITSP